MYQNYIKDLPNLTQDRYENIFNIYLDEDNRYFYNLLQSVILPSNLPESLFDTYTVVPGDTLPFISYKNYRTINLWWMICIANNVVNPTTPFEAGTTLKIPKETIVREVLRQINL